MLAKLIKWHRALAWVAGVSLILWGGSGMLHPVMSWTSPKAVSFMPPAKETLVQDNLQLSASDIVSWEENVSLARVLSLYGHPFLQLGKSDDPVRHFFALDGSNATLEDRDYAIQLARHYSGATEAVKKAEIITQFSRAYPAVNRLLPVWRVEFDRADGLAAYVDTGDDRLGSLTTHLKLALLTIFQTVHTLDFLAPAEAVRVLTIGFLILSIVAIAGIGMALLIKIKRKRVRNNRRGWHRRLAYIAWLPALTFPLTGLFHLVTFSTLRDVHYALPPALQHEVQAFSLPPGIAEMRLATDAAGQGYWIGIPAETVAPMHHHDMAPTHAEHGGGEAKKALKIGVMGPDSKTIPMAEFARIRVAESFAIAPGRLSLPSLVTTFNSEYGFVNKRLPVWRTEDTDSGLLYFYDPIDNIIVKRVDGLAKADNWSFGNLHKWQFLNPLGLLTRDLFMMALVAILIGISVFGLLLIRRKN